MPGRNALYNTGWTSVSQTTAAGQTAITTSILDMLGFESAVFAVQIGAVTNAAVLSCQLKANSANSTTGMANVGSAVVATDVAGAIANQLILVEFYRPLGSAQRYVELVITRSVQNSAVLAILAMQSVNKASNAQIGQVPLNANLAAYGLVLGQ